MRRRCWPPSPISSQNHGWRGTSRAPAPAGLCWKRSVPTRSRSLPSTPRPTSPRNHALYFRDLFPPRGTRSSLSDEDLARHVREIDNVRAALDWSFSSAGDQTIGVDLTAAYAPVWRHLSLMSECRERCERALLSLEPHVTANMWLRMELQMNLARATR